MQNDKLPAIFYSMNKKDIFIAKRGATLILKVTLFIMGSIALLLSIFAFPSILRGGPLEFPSVAYVFSPLVLGLYATTIPFFIGLWQTFKLLSYIEKNQTFSDLSMRTLKNIKYCAIIIGILYMGGLPLLYPIAEADDAPGILVIGFVMACAPIVVAVFAEVLERLLKSAIDIKSENDLTV